jgi:hypothetical protein
MTSPDPNATSNRVVLPCSICGIRGTPSEQPGWPLVPWADLHDTPFAGYLCDRCKELKEGL